VNDVCEDVEEVPIDRSSADTGGAKWPDRLLVPAGRPVSAPEMIEQSNFDVLQKAGGASSGTDRFFGGRLRCF